MCEDISESLLRRTRYSENVLAAGGYWLDPRQGFTKAYVTDATEADLEMVATGLEELADIDAHLDDILNRDEVELDLEVWGSLLE